MKMKKHPVRVDTDFVSLAGCFLLPEYETQVAIVAPFPGIKQDIIYHI